MQKSHKHVTFAFFCLISLQFVRITSVFFTTEACLFQVATNAFSGILLVPKHGGVS